MDRRDQELTVAWLGDSRVVLRSFPSEVRDAIGRALYRVQLGLDPVHWRPMRTVGRGVREIRVRVGTGGRTDYRLLYVARFPEAVYVLHAFPKKTSVTSRRDIELGRQRLAALMAYRGKRRMSDGD